MFLLLCTLEVVTQRKTGAKARSRLLAAGADQRGDGFAAQPLQLRLLPVHLLGTRGARGGSPHGQPRQAVPSKSRCPVYGPV